LRSWCGAEGWSGIEVQGSDYIIVEGFELEGNSDTVTLDYALAQKDNLNDPITSGNGILIKSIVIRNLYPGFRLAQLAMVTELSSTLPEIRIILTPKLARLEHTKVEH